MGLSLSHASLAQHECKSLIMTSIVDETRNSPILGHGNTWTFLSNGNRHFPFRLRQFSATFSSRAPPLELRMLLPELEDGGNYSFYVDSLLEGHQKWILRLCHKFPLPPLPLGHHDFSVLPPFPTSWLHRNSLFFVVFQASIELLLTSLSNCLERIVEIEVPGFVHDSLGPSRKSFRHRFQLNLAWQIWKTQLDAWNFSQTNEAKGTTSMEGRSLNSCCNFFQVCHYLRSEYSDAQETFNEQCWPQMHLCLKSWHTYGIYEIYDTCIFVANLNMYSFRTFQPPSPRRTHLRALKTASPLTSPMTIPVKLARILSWKIFTRKVPWLLTGSTHEAIGCRILCWAHLRRSLGLIRHDEQIPCTFPSPGLQSRFPLNALQTCSDLNLRRLLVMQLCHVVVDLPKELRKKHGIFAQLLPFPRVFQARSWACWRDQARWGQWGRNEKCCGQLRDPSEMVLIKPSAFQVDEPALPFAAAPRWWVLDPPSLKAAFCIERYWDISLWCFEVCEKKKEF